MSPAPPGPTLGYAGAVACIGSFITVTVTESKVPSSTGGDARLSRRRSLYRFVHHSHSHSHAASSILKGKWSDSVSVMAVPSETFV